MNGNRFSSNVLTHALELAEKGFRVFPCAPGQKKPATPNGCKDATTDPNQIRIWWKKYPKANLAISTEGLFVLDVDSIDGKPNPWPLNLTGDQLAELQKAPTAKTPRGGIHYFFLQREGFNRPNTQGKIAPKIDTRGNGGYVLACPSQTSNGSYSWSGGPIPHRDSLPPIPDWLATLSRSKTELDPEKISRAQVATGGPNQSDIVLRARNYLNSCSISISGSGGHNTCFEAALKVINGFAIADDKEALLAFEEWNSRCQPPWSKKELCHKFVEARKNCKDGAWGNLLEGDFEPGDKPFSPPNEPSHQENHNPNDSCDLGSTTQASGTKNQKNQPLSVDWELPIPLANRIEPETEITFPLEVLPEPVEAFAREVGKALNIDPGFAACALITVAAAAIGPKVELQIKEGWIEAPIIWMILVGPASVAKSPLMGKAAKPLEDNQEELVKQFEKEMAKWKKMKIDNAKQKKDNKDNSKDFKIDLNSILESIDDQDIPKPKCQRNTVSDITREALCGVLAENRTRGILSCNDELSGMVKGFDQYKGKGNDRQFILSLWSREQFPIDRVSKRVDEGPLVLKDYVFCILGGLQPSVFPCLQGGDPTAEDGFIDRFLITFPSHLDPIGENWLGVSESSQSNWGEMVKALLDYNLRNLVHLSVEAQASFERITNQIAEDIKGESFPEFLKPSWVKFKRHLARLSLVLHCLRAITDNTYDPSKIGGDVMDGAGKLLEYFKFMTKKARGVMGTDPFASDAQTVLNWITKEKKPAFTRSTVSRALRGRFKDSTRISKALQVLELNGYIRSKSQKDFGPVKNRPATLYEVNPIVLRQVSPLKGETP